jgi:hypothetical protein
MDAEAGPKSFTVAITEETVIDGNETFIVTLSNATGAALGATAVQTVTIIDNDQQPPKKKKSGGGAMSWPVLLLWLLAAEVLRRRPRKPH